MQRREDNAALSNAHELRRRMMLAATPASLAARATADHGLRWGFMGPLETIDLNTAGAVIVRTADLADPNSR
jgi:hypothetical protein